MDLSTLEPSKVIETLNYSSPLFAHKKKSKQSLFHFNLSFCQMRGNIKFIKAPWLTQVLYFDPVIIYAAVLDFRCVPTWLSTCITNILWSPFHRNLCANLQIFFIWFFRNESCYGGWARRCSFSVMIIAFWSLENADIIF